MTGAAAAIVAFDRRKAQGTVPLLDFDLGQAGFRHDSGDFPDQLAVEVRLSRWHRYPAIG